LRAQTGTTAIPGNTKALALAARMQAGIPSGVFVLEYANAIVHASWTSEGKDYIQGLHLYFDTLEELRKRGTAKPDGFDINIDARTLSGFYKAKEIAPLLGWSITATVAGDVSSARIEKASLELSTTPSDAQRQNLASGLGIDFVAARQAVAAGRVYTFHISSDTIPVELGETFWFRDVLKMKPSRGGLLETMVERPEVTRLYLALASMSPETRQVLIATTSPVELARRYSDLLALYGASISISEGLLEIPGGEAANSAWTKLSGTPANRPDAFVKVMLQKDGGKLLAYFHALSQLPPRSQRFFTRTPQRLNAFYLVFPFSERELLDRHVLVRRDSDFFDLANELPLDEHDGVSFPGGPQVWEGNAKPAAPLKAALAADAEDEILLGLIARKQTKAFLDIVRLAKSRYPAMGTAAATVLAQNYSKYQAIYPYFSSFPPLSAEQLAGFFSATDRIDALKRGDRDTTNETLAQFHGIVSLLAILNNTAGLTASDTVRILSGFCAQFGPSPDRTQQTLTALREIVQTMAHGQTLSADELLIQAMSGPSRTVEARNGGRSWVINRQEREAERIRSVLAAQHIRPLEDLLKRGAGVDQTVSVGTMLAAWSYAYYGSPSDLLIAEDPQFIQRHRYLSEGTDSLWEPTELKNCSDGRGGLCVTGGLAGIGEIAGKWGRIKADSMLSFTGEGFNEPAVEAELASIRTFPWTRTTPTEFLNAGRQVVAGRQLVTNAGSDPSLRAVVVERLTGRVSSARRGEISRLLAEHNPRAALDLLSASELYAVAAKDPSSERAAVLLRRLEGPCEEYEALPRPQPLWSCANDLILSLAAAAAQDGLPMDAVATLAEPALLHIWKHLQMRNSTDWLAVVRAANHLDLNALLPELNKP
jgi:hypothetical protein